MMLFKQTIFLRKRERNRFGEVSNSAGSRMELKVRREIVPVIICLEGFSNCRYDGKVYWFDTFKRAPRLYYKVDRGAWVIWAATWQNQQSDCAPSEDSDQPRHPPSLIRVFADAQADLNLRRAPTHFVDFVMSRLIFDLYYNFKTSVKVYL